MGMGVVVADELPPTLLPPLVLPLGYCPPRPTPHGHARAGGYGCGGGQLPPTWTTAPHTTTLLLPYYSSTAPQAWAPGQHGLDAPSRNRPAPPATPSPRSAWRARVEGRRAGITGPRPPRGTMAPDRRWRAPQQRWRSPRPGIPAFGGRALQKASARAPPGRRARRAEAAAGAERGRGRALAPMAAGGPCPLVPPLRRPPHPRPRRRRLAHCRLLVRYQARLKAPQRPNTR